VKTASHEADEASRLPMSIIADRYRLQKMLTIRNNAFPASTVRIAVFV
jgi:hypothetical protein